MTYAVLDTNVFLHYRHFTELPWPKLLCDQVMLTVTPTVLVELESLKYASSDSSVRARARKIARLLYELRGTNTIRLILQTELPPNLYADITNEDNDLRVIEETAALKELHPDQSVLIVTADTGMMLKAESRGIQVFEMPEIFRLTEDDERDRELRKARAELADLKNQMPTVRLGFENDDTKILLPACQVNQPDREALEKAVQTRISPMAHKRQSLFQSPNYDDNWKAYQKAYERYVKLYSTFVVAEWHFNNRVFPLSFVLSNTGAVRATDIEVRLHFPDGFEVKEFIDPPSEPEDPQPPTTIEDTFALIAEGIDLMPTFPAFNLPRLTSSDISPRGPRLHIKRTNSFDVTYSILNLKQRSKSEPMAMYIEYADSALPKSFKINSRVIVGNGRGDFECNLHVKCLPNSA
jgi:hypothetical protein